MREGQIYSADEVGALWLHFRVDMDRSQWQGWLLEFPIPVLDLATVYLQDARGQWQAQSAGDTLPVTTWPEAGRYPTFRLNLAPGQPRDIYVRIRHTTPISLPVRFVSQGAHDQRIQVEYMALGMAFGALLLLIAACAAQAWVYRDRIYAWYCGVCRRHDAGCGGLHRRGRPPAVARLGLLGRCVAGRAGPAGRRLPRCCSCASSPVRPRAFAGWTAPSIFPAGPAWGWPPCSCS
jgi:hypothetical protein